MPKNHTSAEITQKAFRLCFSELGQERKVLLVDGANLVGSSTDCEVPLADPSVSRRHATIFLEHEVLSIVDWESKNGTHLDQRKVRRRKTFEVGAILSFGQVSATVERVDALELEPAIVFGDGPPPPVPSLLTESGQTTMAGVPHHGFLFGRLPGLLERIVRQESPTAVAQDLGEGLVEALGTNCVEIIEDRLATGAILFTGGQSPDEEEACLEETIGDMKVRIGIGQARTEHQAMISIVASLLRLSSGAFDCRSVERSPEITPARPPEPPTMAPEVREIYRQAAAVAQGKIGVLILGESGTGKEVLARYLHDSSSRRAGPFIAVNCASLPKDLIESELFGIEKGVATGVDARVGKFEQASGGTLFLDEIGDMHPETQVSILRVLQEGEVYRVGGTTPHLADARILAATNRDMTQMVADEIFRLDLYHRISDWEVRLPPLRERAVDVGNLAAFFLERAAAERGVKARGISRAALEKLSGFDWPGNIRQLEREIMRAVLFLGDGDLLESRHLSSTLQNGPRVLGTGLKERLEDFERSEIRRALAESGGKVSRAAEMLEIPSSTLYRRIKELDLVAEPDP